MELKRINVVTRDEYREAQEPTGFEWKGNHYRVAQVLDRWYEGHMSASRLPLRYFKVRTQKGDIFILRYHEFFRAWSLLVSRESADE